MQTSNPQLGYYINLYKKCKLFGCLPSQLMNEKIKDVEILSEIMKIDKK